MSASPGGPAVLTHSQALFQFGTSFHIGAIRSIPSCVRPHTMFWSWSRHHCWIPSTVVWEQESSGRATLRSVCLWGWRLPLWTATRIAGALKPLLLSISRCTLRSTCCIQHHVHVPVLWISICRQTQSPRWKQPSQCWIRPFGLVTHTEITERNTGGVFVGLSTEWWDSWDGCRSTKSLLSSWKRGAYRWTLGNESI